jgi:hypothetical protein
MALLRDIFIKKPKFSNFDLSRVNRLTMAPGILYPVFVEETLPKDKWNLSVSGLFKTYPLLAPLMGRFQVRVDFFYAPMSLYVKALRNDPSSFDPSDILFPIVNYLVKPYQAGEGDLPKISPSSLRSLLGMVPPGSPGGVTSGGSTFGIPMNAMPMLAYYDIFYNYYANTQEPYFLVGAGGFDGTYQPTPIWVNQVLSSIPDGIDWVLSNPGKIIVPSSPDISPWNDPNSFPDWPDKAAVPMSWNSSAAAFGSLIRRTYKPDVNSAWLSKSSYETMVTGARVNVGSDDAFTINELRYANKLMKYNERGIVSGGRYSDWIKAEYGFNIQKWLDVPEYLGSTSCYLNFEDVVQTGGGNFYPGGNGDVFNPLGTLGGRGRGFMNGANHIFTTPENGYIMGIASIIPIPDYYQGSHSRFLKTNFGDLYTPSLDRIGFQARLQSELSALPERDSDGAGGNIVWTPSDNPFKRGVFYQPAWTEYMTAVNEIHGDFADPDKLRYWVLARSFMKKGLPGQAANAVLFDHSSYIDPTEFNDCFADTSATAENFQMQFAFDVKSHRAISKRLMPTL